MEVERTRRRGGGGDGGGGRTATLGGEAYLELEGRGKLQGTVGAE